MNDKQKELERASVRMAKSVLLLSSQVSSPSQTIKAKSGNLKVTTRTSRPNRDIKHNEKVWRRSWGRGRDARRLRNLPLHIQRIMWSSLPQASPEEEGKEEVSSHLFAVVFHGFHRVVQALNLSSVYCHPLTGFLWFFALSLKSSANIFIMILFMTATTFGLSSPSHSNSAREELPTCQHEDGKTKKFSH